MRPCFAAIVRVAYHYKRMTDLVKSYDINIISLDCDGLIDSLIPSWLENGISQEDILLSSSIYESLDIYAVSTQVNSSKTEGADLALKAISNAGTENERLLASPGLRR